MAHFDQARRMQRDAAPMSMTGPAITPRSDQCEAHAAVLDALARGVLRPSLKPAAAVEGAVCPWITRRNP
jgi:hypothetical protein